MEKTNKEKIELIKKMMKINDSSITKNELMNHHITTLQSIYEARKKFMKLDVKSFNKWLKNQTFYEGGLPLSLIGYIMGITRERVRQVETSAIKKLKHPKVGKKLKELIEV